MLSTRISKDFYVFDHESLNNALQKINNNSSKIIFVIKPNNSLVGSLSDGDIRRALLSNPDININESKCKDYMNKDVTYIHQDNKNFPINNLFVNGRNCIPIVDSRKRIVQVIFQDLNGFYIGENQISDVSKVFVIAEIGNNHQGSFNKAKNLVQKVIDSGGDCAKFQMRSMKSLYKNNGNKNDNSADLGAQYTLDLLSKFQLSDSDLFKIFDYCYEKGIKPLCTPWDLKSLKLLEEYGMEAYKIASADLTNYELLEAVSMTGKPIICSTGMSTESEIISSTNFLISKGVNFALLHCNSTYPTPFKDVNLRYIKKLKKIAKDNIVGYSGHERGYSVVLGSVAMGAKIIEKHITIDKKLEGTDHKVSLLPEEFKEMVDEIRNLEEAIGVSDKPREISQGELINRENLAKSLVSSSNIKKGDVITRHMIEIKSPGLGLQPNRMKDLIGKTSNRDIKKNEFFFLTDIEGQIDKKNTYNFKRPFGVPVRYHDYEAIIANTNLDFIEFHLSYSDVLLDIKKFFKRKLNINFCVHAPELFENDHILDLCSNNEQYRKKSIDHFQNIINLTKDLNKYFPKTKNPIIVLNAGGWNPDGFIPLKEVNQLYENLENSLSRLEMDEVIVAIQTMPPFPWHFGGQSYHNLFIHSEEIINFCRRNKNIKICLDISHTMMAANYYGFDLYEYIEKISPFVVHMHVVDAKGDDGEGVEIGKGDVNFEKLSKILDKSLKDIQFLPEIWQGHKNKGEGFWKALNFLEDYL